MQKKIIIIFLVVFALLVGCGTTTITATNPRADIYVDGAMLGTGVVEISRMGTPKTIECVAKLRNREIGKATVSRSFTYKTALFGLYTYGVGLFTSWELPETIIIPCENSGFDNNKFDPWDPKNNGWDKKK